MCCEPKPRRAFTSTGKSRSSGSAPGSQLAGDWTPFASKNSCARYLSFTRSTTSAAGEQTLVEVGERDDQADVVLLHELAQRRDVGRIVDPRRQHVEVGVIKGRREGARVHGDRG